MHEMGVAMQIIEIARASIPGHINNVQVKKIHLKIGKLAAIVPESLLFCFDVVTKDNPSFSGATLVIEDIPVIAKCKKCNFKWQIDQPVFTCKSCLSGEIELLSGRELDIDSIEIIDEDADDVDD